MLDTYMNALDLTLLSIYRINDQEWPLSPGLLALNPSKKIARGRDQDRLLVYLTLGGNVGFSASEYGEIATQVADIFYSTPGSLTFALKTAAELLNSFLAERNMKSTGKGLYSIGALVLCNLRGNSMYIVQSGPTHVYHLAGETRHLYDPQLAGKGLGLGQSARMYFSQVTLSAGDRLLICAALPPDWETPLSSMTGSESLESIRARLLGSTKTNVSAVLVQASDGSGAMNILRAVKDDPVQPSSPAIPTPVSVPAILDELQIPEMAPVVLAVESAGETEPAQDAQVLDEENQQLSAKESRAVAPVLSRQAPVSRKSSREAKPLVQSEREQIDQGVRSTARNLAGSLRSLRTFTQKLALWIEKAIPRLLPDTEDDQPQKIVSRSWAIFFAVAIPVLFFVIARIVYYQLGYEAQYKIYFDQAQETAQKAVAETSPLALRVEWQTTLDWLDKAAPYELEPNPDAQKLRQDAQTALDTLDRVVRHNFILAFNAPLSRNLHVSRMVASDSDLYLLDSVNGSVLRGIFNGKDYDLDGGFQCGLGVDKQGVQVDKLIDIVSVPNSRVSDVSLIGIDGSGKLLLCIPGEKPVVTVLQPPGTGWKGITAIAFDAFNLYVLDAAAHAVWIYESTEKLEFSEPQFFFGEQVPVMLDQAIDMAVNGDDIYLLHQDGHMAICTFSHLDASPTRCSDPALYVDSRPGYEGGMSLSDGIFSQIDFTSAPDPSVVLLEPFTQAVFRFSPRSLELQNQVRTAAGSENILPKGVPVTAMAFSPNKSMFLFLNGQVYFSTNVP